MDPATPPPDHPKANKLGLWLFLVYLAIYGGFVWVAAFSGPTLGGKPFGGVNLAIVWGFGLIIIPLVLALAYLAWAGKAED